MNMVYSPSIESHTQGGIAIGQHFAEGHGIVPVSQPIHAALCSVVHRLGLVRLGLVRLGLVRLGLVRLGLVRLGLVALSEIVRK